MTRSARLFLCARCRDQVLLCSHCDRGQLYCGRACSFAARRERRRETAKRYQDSRGGRLKHAARTACWRARRGSPRHGAGGAIDKVTHQGCPLSAADALLLACDTPGACELTTLTEAAADAEPAATAAAVSFAALACRRCAHPLRPHVRSSWLRSNRLRRSSRHDHPS